MDLVDMIFNYEERKVQRDECENFTLDTCEVYDRTWIYETAVSHKNYNNGKWIILEGTNTKEAALEAHKKWLKGFIEGVDYRLVDCYTKEIFYESEGE